MQDILIEGGIPIMAEGRVFFGSSFIAFLFLCCVDSEVCIAWGKVFLSQGHVLTPRHEYEFLEDCGFGSGRIRNFLPKRIRICKKQSDPE